MSATVNSYLKTAFFIIVILQFAPPLFKNITKYWEQSINPRNKVGYLVLNEPIYSSTEHIKKLHTFFKDNTIKAIILKLECPGGAAGASQAIAQEIKTLKAEHPKPIISYIENVCASGGYLIAASTDHIISTGAATVGSIGSRLPTMFKLKKALEKYEVYTETVGSGTYKNIADRYTDMSEEERTLLQKMSDDCYNQFVTEVAQLRHLSLANSKEWADGKIFTGKNAYDLKLVDKIGNLATAIEYVKKQIIPGDRKVQLVHAPQKNIIEKYLQGSDESFEIEQSLTNRLFHGFLQLLETPRITVL